MAALDMRTMRRVECNHRKPVSTTNRSTLAGIAPPLHVGVGDRHAIAGVGLPQSARLILHA
jgi:hypothetical protein